MDREGESMNFYKLPLDRKAGVGEITLENPRTTISLWNGWSHTAKSAVLPGYFFNAGNPSSEDRGCLFPTPVDAGELRRISLKPGYSTILTLSAWGPFFPSVNSNVTS